MISDVLLVLSAIRQKQITVADFSVGRLLNSGVSALVAEVRCSMARHGRAAQM